jgi:predicted glycoside hydrolase/deacetylase ChbG (UPF0249 family)
MAARLILNADDFGLTRGINRAVGELHAAGTLTSATLMATGAAFEDAVAIAHARPGLGVGCHIVFIDGTPAAPLGKIPSLLAPNGKTFRPTLSSFLLDLARGKIDEGQVLIECLFQIEKLQRAGVRITHLDTHKHTHIWPPIASALLRAAERTGIAAVRNPFEPPWSLSLGAGSLSRGLQLRLIEHLRRRFLELPQIASGTVRTTDGTLGISATGNLNAATISAMLAAMPEGTWELCCHPGYNDTDLDAITTRLRSTRDTERLALLAAFGTKSLHPSSPRLIQYADLDSSLFPFPSSLRAEPTQ